ncbi:MAG: hypothetical protein WBD01_08465, partial [Salaquimonas sp.]
VHPILCTPEGPINVLPDHPHEGECVIPSNLNVNYSIGNDTFREYPNGSNGKPVPPVIVATSTMLKDATIPAGDPNFPAKPRIDGGTFSAIAAWDGTRTGNSGQGKHGRIVVDATWHHFLNVNLVGRDPDIGDGGFGGFLGVLEPKRYGFLVSDEGRQHLARIKQYYKNTARWLAPRTLRRCWWLRHIAVATQNPQVLELISGDPEPQEVGYVLLQHWKVVGPCERWIFISDTASEIAFEIRDMIDPFDVASARKKTRKMIDKAKVNEHDIGVIVAAALAGSMFMRIRALKLKPQDFKKGEADNPKLSRAAKTGIKDAKKLIKRMLVRQKREEALRQAELSKVLKAL